MTSLSNIKIGRKIALVLGGIVLLLTGLSVLSLWGTSANQKAAATVDQRLTKARLAEIVTGETAAIGQNVGIMVLAGQIYEDAVSRIAESRKIRNAAFDQFRAMADTPTSVKQGADMAEEIQVVVAHLDRIVAMLKARRAIEAAKEYRLYTAANLTLRAKAKEAAEFQLVKAAEAEKASKGTASTIWISLIVGSLIAMAGAILVESFWPAVSRYRSQRQSRCSTVSLPETSGRMCCPNFWRAETKSACSVSLYRLCRSTCGMSSKT